MLHAVTVNRLVIKCLELCYKFFLNSLKYESEENL